MADTPAVTAPAPTPAQGAAGIIADQSATLDTERQQVLSRQAALDKQETQSIAGRERELAPLEANMTAANNQPAPVRPPTEKIPEFKPEPIVDAKQYEQFSYGLLGMALIGGAASKGNWLGVSATLNGALKGYMDGNKEVAAKQYQDFQKQFESAKAKEEQANKEFERILQDRNLSINQKIQQYKLAAAKYDRQDMRMAAEQKSIDHMWTQYYAHTNALAKTGVQNTQFTIKIDQAQAKAAAAQNGTGGAVSQKYNSDENYKKNVDYWANYVSQGGTLPARFAQSLGKQFAQDVYAAVPQLSGGNPGDQIANQVNRRGLNAEAQKLGTQSASVAIANKELQKFIPLAEKAIDSVPSTNWRPLNEVIQREESTWSPEQKRLVIANRSVLNAYAQLIQRGAPTVHSLSEAEHLLSTADSPRVYKAAMDQLRQEGEQADQGLKEAHSDLMSRARSGGAAMDQLRQEGEQADQGLKEAHSDLMSRARSGGAEGGAKPGGGGLPAGWSVEVH